MKEQRRISVTNIGTSSMFVILFGLCFAVLAALAVAAAGHDYKLSQQLAEHTTNYYEACNLAQERLLEIEELYVQADEEGYVSFEVSMQEGQALLVELCFAETSADYRVTKWQVISTGEWDGDESLPVIKRS